MQFSDSSILHTDRIEIVQVVEMDFRDVLAVIQNYLSGIWVMAVFRQIEVIEQRTVGEVQLFQM